MKRTRTRDAFGLPNGGDPTAYDGKRSASAWRWEFLRRRRDYLDDWTKHAAKWQRAEVKRFADMPLPAGVTSWRGHFADIARMPRDEQRQRYTVAHLVNPALDWDAAAFLGVFLTRAELSLDAARKSVPSRLRGHEHRFEAMHVARLAADDELARADVITAHIDLRQPIKPQLEHLEKWATARRAELSGKPAVSRLRESEWRSYLRILDLDRQGMTLDDIAGRVFPHDGNKYPDYKASHRAAAALKQAKHLQATIAIEG